MKFDGKIAMISVIKGRLQPVDDRIMFSNMGLSAVLGPFNLCL